MYESESVYGVIVTKSLSIVSVGGQKQILNTKGTVKLVVNGISQTRQHGFRQTAQRFALAQALSQFTAYPDADSLYSALQRLTTAGLVDRKVREDRVAGFTSERSECSGSFGPGRVLPELSFRAQAFHRVHQGGFDALETDRQQRDANRQTAC